MMTIREPDARPTTIIRRRWHLGAPNPERLHNRVQIKDVTRHWPEDRGPVPEESKGKYPGCWIMEPRQFSQLRARFDLWYWLLSSNNQWTVTGMRTESLQPTGDEVARFGTCHQYHRRRMRRECGLRCRPRPTVNHSSVTFVPQPTENRVSNKNGWCLSMVMYILAASSPCGPAWTGPLRFSFGDGNELLAMPKTVARRQPGSANKRGLRSVPMLTTSSRPRDVSLVPRPHKSIRSLWILCEGCLYREHRSSWSAHRGSGYLPTYAVTESRRQGSCFSRLLRELRELRFAYIKMRRSSPVETRAEITNLEGI